MLGEKPLCEFGDGRRLFPRDLVRAGDEIELTEPPLATASTRISIARGCVRPVAALTVSPPQG